MRRRRLIYFYAENLHSGDAYSIRERTLRQARERKEEWGRELFGPVYRVTIRFHDAFDLLASILGEGGEQDLVVERKLARGESEPTPELHQDEEGMEE